MTCIIDLFKYYRWSTRKTFLLEDSLRSLECRNPQTRFVIVGAARTGSTMLRLMLNSHSQILSHGEIFAKAMRGFVGIEARIESPLKRWLVQIRDRDPIFFLNKLAFFSDSAKAVGFKILYATLREERLKQMINTIRVDRKIKIIHITRRNRLKRLISQRLAKLSGVTVLIDQEQKPQTPKVSVLLKELVADIQEIEKEERYIRESFKSHPLFEVAYEDIVEREQEMTESLQRYLNVKPTKLYSRTLKLGSENLADSIANLEELKAETNGTCYAVYFDQ